ncbi:DUF4153 domain-containing protein [Streptomyces sp. NPDC059578]|uniref:DUF4153 domain-containing protein n=1 Tax=Streptomyces sp. NPDC059578 TaxID=3346874 RepID=UPI0036C58D8A
MSEKPTAQPEPSTPPGAPPAPPARALARSTAPPTGPGHPSRRPGAASPADPWSALRSRAPRPIRSATLWSVLATGVLGMVLLGDGIGLNLLLVALPASLAAYHSAVGAGRRPRPWTLLWGAGGLVLLAVPALRDASWPSFLAVVAAFWLGALALHGSRTWAGIAFSPFGLVEAVPRGLSWGWRGLRERSKAPSSRVGPVLRALGVTAALLLVFGALFAAADAAFAELLDDLVPEVSGADGPLRLLLLALGLLGALGVAYAAGSPVRWDRVSCAPGRARGRVEWALPLLVLNGLFALFIAVQLTVLFGGYDTVLEKTDLSYAEYARQGFWQLLLATLLVLVVIVAAVRWAPRGGPKDGVLVRAVLGTLGVLTLVVVASAVRRMDMYVDAYGWTRLRISVVAVEAWLGLVIVLIMAAGVWGVRWLPRAVAASAALGVLLFGAVSPDALIAERSVQRHEETGQLDLDYVRDLSADAVPALDALPEPLRSCALRSIDEELRRHADEPWYATSLGEARARTLLNDRPVQATWTQCQQVGRKAGYP